MGFDAAAQIGNLHQIACRISRSIGSAESVDFGNQRGAGRIGLCFTGHVRSVLRERGGSRPEPEAKRCKSASGTKR